MITVKERPDTNLEVRFDYYQPYVDKMHKVSFAEFDKEDKCWIVPSFASTELEEEFKGELAYLTPKWEIDNEKVPDYKEQYKISRDIKVPTLKLKPFDYQEYGIKYMINKLYDNKMVMNCDDVGLGKTLSAIGTLKYMIDNFGYKKIIIVCQKSLKAQWLSEIKKFSDIVDNTMKPFIVGGTKKQREKTYQEISNLNEYLVITNYHTVMNDKDIIKKFNFDMLICDEVHKIKARTGVINKAMQEVCKNIKKAVFLTGTPVTDKPDDLFGIVQIIDKKYFGKWKDFESRYITKDTSSRYERIVGYKHLDELREKCQNLIIRRTEKEVNISLPEVMPTKEIFTQIDAVQNKIADKITKMRKDLSENIDTLKNKNNLTKKEKLDLEKYQSIEKGLIACSQANADDPRLFTMSSSKMMKKLFSDLVPKNYKRSEKMEALLEEIESIPSDEKIIIFSKFARCCCLIASDIESELKLKTLIYDGSKDDTERTDIINKFNNDSSYRILIMSAAGEEGLNLQVARHQFNFEVPDNPASETQRKGRIRRAGSIYDRVFTYTLLTENTIDISKLEKLNKAKELVGNLVELDEAQSNAIKQAMNEKS